MAWKNVIATGFSGGYPQSWGLTPFRERGVESPSMSFGENRDTAQRQYFVPWLNNPVGAAQAAWQASKDFRGYTELAIYPLVQANPTGGYTTTNQKYLRRHTPHPFYSTTANFTSPWQFCNDITRWEVSREAGQDSNLIGVGREALMTVVYGAFPYRIFTDTTLQFWNALAVLANPAPQQLQIFDEATLARYTYSYFEPGGKWQAFKGFSTISWDRDTTPVVQEENVLLNDGDLFIDWYQIPIASVPITAIQNCIGKTNKFPMSSYSGWLPVSSNITSTTNLPAGPNIISSIPSNTLIMSVPKFDKPYRMADGNYATNVRYRFKYKPFGANSFYRPNIRKLSGVYNYVLVNNTPGSPIHVSLTNITKLCEYDWLEFADGSGVVQDTFQITSNSNAPLPFNPGALQPGIAFTGNDAYLVRTAGNAFGNQPTTIANNGSVQLSPGFYSASRNPLSGKRGGLLFAPTDYAALFRPEP